MTFNAYQVMVQVQATGPVELHRYTGSALRGALFKALWGRFCTNKAAVTCAECPLVQVCPVSSLVAPLRNEHSRGRDVPRPYALRQPVHHARTFAPGEQFVFGMTLFGQMVQLFPYVAMSFHEMGQLGLGKRVEQNGWERGQFVVDKVVALNPLTQTYQIIQASGSNMVATPELAITWQDALDYAHSMPADRICLEFLSPLRLVENKLLLKLPLLRPLVQRLTERFDALATWYGGTPLSRESRQVLIEHAETIELVQHSTRWVDVDSYSSRQRRKTPIGGLVGSATYAGDLRPLLPLLVWGSIMQAGKDTTKGNGMYELRTPQI